MKTVFQINEFPLHQFKAIGLYQENQLLLSSGEIQALLSGRRTSLLSLNNLTGKDFAIERLDARLSLHRKDNGELELFIHPIYKQVRHHPLLNAQEEEDLIRGNKTFIGKKIDQEEGRSTMFNVEYDTLTRSFVGYDVSKVQAPDRVNNMLLSEEEKSSFKRGELVTLPDGTRLMHRASEPKGMLSDRQSLVLSVLLDGGISYLLLRGIRALHDNALQLSHLTPAFQDAMNEMEGARKNENQRTIDHPLTVGESYQRKMSR